MPQFDIKISGVDTMKLKIDFTSASAVRPFTMYVDVSSSDYNTYWDDSYTTLENFNLLLHRDCLSKDVVHLVEVLSRLGDITCIKWEEETENFNGIYREEDIDARTLQRPSASRTSKLNKFGRDKDKLKHHLASIHPNNFLEFIKGLDLYFNINCLAMPPGDVVRFMSSGKVTHDETTLVCTEFKRIFGKPFTSYNLKDVYSSRP